MDWLSETPWLWWVAAALVLGLVEIVSLDLVFTMLAAAAVAAALAAGAGLGFTGQVLVFVAAAVALLALARPVALRWLKPTTPGERTNIDASVGHPAEVLREVTDRNGLVKLRGEEWSARAEAGDDTAYPPGEILEVVRIEGATAIVVPRTQEPRHA